MSLDPLTQKLIGSGSPFELMSVSSADRQLRIYRHAPGTLIELYQRALKKSDLELVVFDGTRLTFRQAFSAAGRMSALLRANFGISRGDRVAIVGDDATPEWLEAFLAITLLRATPVLIGRRDARQIEHCIGVSRPKLVLADAIGVAAQRESATRVEAVAAEKPPWIDLRELAADAARLHLALPEQEPASSFDEAVVLFTSGSTGNQKAVVLTHVNLISGLMNMMLGGTLAAAEDRSRAPVAVKLPPCALIHTPLSYIGGLSGILMAIMNGTRVVVTKGWDIEAVCSLVEAEKVTSLPHLSRAHLEELMRHEAVTHRLASIGLHGASVPRKLIENIWVGFPALKIVSGYGLTETSGSIAVISGRMLRERPGSSGRIVPSVDVRLGALAADAGADEEWGELIVAGACVMRGYARESGASDITCFNTGDVAHIAADGHVYIDYRSSESAVIGGMRFNTATVERDLENLDGVSEVSVLTGTQREQLCLDIAVAAVPGHKVEREHIERALASLVGTTGAVRIHFCESLPRTTSGKVDRPALRASLAGAAAQSASS
jgi:long-chain acyl-CoA synthetase